jgi:GT2 family glycosyltransferase
MDFSIIIVNWNVKSLLKKCLASIFEKTQDISFEAIVVDNNSTDGSQEMLRELVNNQPNLKLILNDFNAGFAKANNQGAKIAKGRYLLFMNPDMESIEDSANKLVSFMEKHPGIAASTCQLIYPDGQRQNNIKRDPSFWSQFFILLKLHHFLTWLPPIKSYLAKDFDYTREQAVQQVMGTFLFIRREIFEKINGWNEDYWLWWEDVDLCQRIRKAGETIFYTPVTKIVHYEGKSFEQKLSLEKQKQFNHGMLIYFKKYHSRLTHWGLLVLQPISLLLAYLSQLLDIKPRPQGKI